MSIANDILLKLHEKNIYEGYEPEYDLDLHGGEHLEIYEQLFDKIKPTIVLEVGSWKGRSAIHFAKMLKKMGGNGAVICIDTWLGGIEHLPPEITESWSIQKYRKNGYPKLYNQFLSNIVREKVHDVIIPLPNTSNTGAKWLKNNNIKADLIYVDASHEFEDVKHDLTNYYELLNENGIIFGDDFAGFEGVRRAVIHFSDMNNLNYKMLSHQVWAIQKGDKKNRSIKKYFRQGGIRSFLKDIAISILKSFNLEITRKSK